MKAWWTLILTAVFFLVGGTSGLLAEILGGLQQVQQAAGT